MKIALIATRKVPNAERFLFSNCTEIFTNIKGFTHETIPVTYSADLDLLIKNANFVIALCFRKVKKQPPILSKCNRYKKIYAFEFVD